MSKELWTTSTLRLAIEGPSWREEVSLNKPFARLGADRRAEYVLRGKDIKNVHLYVQIVGSSIYYIDFLKSEADQKIVAGWILPGVSLSVGEHHVFAWVMNRDTLAGSRTASFPREKIGPPYPAIDFSHRGQLIIQGRLSRVLTVVGRIAPSTFRFHSPQVSLNHCLFYWTGDSMWVIDLLSETGTWHRRTQIEVAELNPGDSIKLGGVTGLYQGADSRSKKSKLFSQESSPRTGDPSHNTPHDIPAQIHSKPTPESSEEPQPVQPTVNLVQTQDLEQPASKQPASKQTVSIVQAQSYEPAVAYPQRIMSAELAARLNELAASPHRDDLHEADELDELADEVLNVFIANARSLRWRRLLLFGVVPLLAIAALVVSVYLLREVNPVKHWIALLQRLI